MSDRHEQARAEAYRQANNADSYAPADATRYGGFMSGVEWADANPQPHTITREELERAWWATCPDGVDFVLDEFMNELGIEVRDD